MTEKIKIKYIVDIFPKSNIQASEGEDEGLYPFYTSSQVLEKKIDRLLYETDGITMGTGGGSSVNYSPIPFSTSTDCFNFKQKNGNSKYLYYCVFSILDKINDIYFEGMGLKHLQKNDFLNEKVYFPDSKAREKIISFLDKKTKEIDLFIAYENSNIEKLLNLRQRIISESVLKGIKSCNFKTVKNRWLSIIPSSWEIKKVKYLLNSEEGIKVGPFGSALSGKVLYDESDIKIYGQWNVIGKSFDIDRNFIQNKDFSSLKQYEVVPGDILISMMGTIGKCLTVPTNIKKGIMDSHIIKIRLNNSIYDSKFFEYVYDKDNSDFVWEQLNYLKKGSIMDGLNSSILKEIFLPVPPIKEQLEIVRYLNEKIGAIDDLIRLKEEKIEKLTQYKTSLVYDYVSGRKSI